MDTGLESDVEASDPIRCQEEDASVVPKNFGQRSAGELEGRRTQVDGGKLRPWNFG